MLQFFKTNQILGAILFLPYLGILYSAALLAEPPAPGATPGILSSLILTGIEEWPSLYLRLFSLLLVFFQAILITLLVNANRINSEFNLFPGLFYCLFAGMMPEFMSPSPTLLANTFLILALVELFAVYKIPIAAGRLFNVGLFISMAGLFYFSSLWLLVFAFWGASSLRAFNVRDHLAILFGAFTPFFLTATVFYLLDRLPEFWEVQFFQNLRFFDFYAVQDGLILLKIILFSLLILVALIASGGYFQKKIMHVQKKISLLYSFLLFTGFAVAFQSQADMSHWLLACIPLSIFFSMSFSTMPSRWAEVVHLLMLAAGLSMAYSLWLTEGF